MKFLPKVYAGGVILLSLFGCGKRQCEDIARGAFDSSLQPSMELRDPIARAYAASPSDPLQLLFLTGGTGNAAFGAGVLRGWRLNDVHPRPREFEIVAGTGAGALQATFAFIGSELDDEALENSLTSVGAVEMHQNELFSSAALKSPRPMAETLARYVTDYVIDRVARIGHQSSRRLYVATTDLDQGSLRIWDLTEVASSPDHGRYVRYRKILRASASLPALRPAVVLEGRLHGDGRLRERRFIDELLIPLGEAHAKHGERRRSPPTVWALVNDQLGVTARCVDDAVAPLAFRALALAVDEGRIGSLARGEQLANRFGFRWRFLTIHDQTPTRAESDEVYQGWIGNLYSRGVNWGQHERWKETLSGFTPAPPRSTSAVERSAKSLKGWELYTWEETDGWRFQLLPGTNRVKTDAEITAGALRSLGELRRKLETLSPGETLLRSGTHPERRRPLPPDLEEELQAMSRELDLQFLGD